MQLEREARGKTSCAAGGHQALRAVFIFSRNDHLVKPGGRKPRHRLRGDRWASLATAGTVELAG